MSRQPRVELIDGYLTYTTVEKYRFSKGTETVVRVIVEIGGSGSGGIAGKIEFPYGWKFDLAKTAREAVRRIKEQQIGNDFKEDASEE